MDGDGASARALFLLCGVLALRPLPSVAAEQGLSFSNDVLSVEWRRGEDTLALTNRSSRQMMRVGVGPARVVFASGRVEGFEGAAAKVSVERTAGGTMWKFVWPARQIAPGRAFVLCRVAFEMDRRSGWIHKRVTVELASSEASELLEEVVIDALDVKGLGASQPFSGWQSYPVLCDSFFAGVAFPAAQARMAADVASLACQPGVRLGSWQAYEAKPAIYGVTPPGRSREAFESYIGSLRPPSGPIHVQYNSWWSAPYPFTERQMLDIAEAFRENYATPHGGRLDSFCLDMGWALSQSMWQIDRSNFPKGFAPLIGELEKMHAGLALWVSPSSCYQSPGGLDSEWAARQGYETFLRKVRPKRFACLAGPRYAAALRDVLVEHTRAYDIAHYKFDGYVAICPQNNHGHEPGPLSAQRMAEGFIDVCEALRREKPGIWLEATCFGQRPSPWWLAHVNTVIGTFGSDSPAGRVPCPIYRESATTARDFFNLQGARDVLIPTSAQEVLGIVHQTADPLQNDAVTVVLRGHSFLPLYVNPRFMDARRWRFLARLTNWARENASLLARTRAVPLGDWADDRQGGDWRKDLPRDPYGYAHFDGSRGLLLLRNPWVKPRRVALRLDESLGVDRLLRDVPPVSLYPTFRRFGPKVSYGGQIVVDLKPYETRLIAFGGYAEAPAARDDDRRVAAKDVRSQADGAQGSALLTFDVGDGLSGRQLWMLCESSAGFQSPSCTVEVDGAAAEVRTTMSCAGWWSGPVAPEQWAWLIADLPTGKCRVRADVLAQDDVRFSAWLVVKEPLPDDDRAAGPIPPPEERILDAVELQSPVELKGPAPRGGQNMAAASQGAKASASSVWSPQLGPDKAIDGDAESRWNSRRGDVAGAWLAVDLGKPRTISTVGFREAAGGRITGYKIQVYSGGDWRDVACVAKPAERVDVRCRFRPVTTGRVRLLITAARNVPTLYELEVR